jgi:preprotein translocase subunit SecA
VVYGKRQHALYGERLALDLDNAFYSVADGLVAGFKEQQDFQGFELGVIVNFGMQTQISADEFKTSNQQALAEQLYDEAIANYNRKKKEMAHNSLPVFTNIRASQGAHIQNVVVPFTDGRKMMQVLTPLEKTIETGGVELTNAVERTITLALIDDAWKEHLRAMDDLKQSVQLAHLEQKDPLVIYKVEAFNLFKVMDAEVNKDIVQFLCHCAIPQEEQGPQQRIQEGRVQKTDMSKMRENKAEIDAAGQDYAANQNDYFDPSANVKQEPIRVEPKVGRNDACPCGSGKKFKNCHGK